MIIGYTRVSTDQQSDDLQTEALIKSGAEKIYSDIFSAKKSERPHLDAMLSSLRKGDRLIVWKLDRLGSSLKDLITLVNKFYEQGVEFISLQDNIDTTTPSGKLIFHIFGALAEFEADVIKDRTLAGLEATREPDRRGGRKKKLSQHSLELAQTMLKDHTVTSVAKQLGVDRRTLRRSLDRYEA